MGSFSCKLQKQKYKVNDVVKTDEKKRENKKEPAQNDRGRVEEAPASSYDTSEHSDKLLSGDHEDTHSETTYSDSSDSNWDGAKDSKHGSDTVHKTSKAFIKETKCNIYNKKGNLHIGDIDKQIVIYKEYKVSITSGFDAENKRIIERKSCASSSISVHDSCNDTRNKHIKMDCVANLSKRSEVAACVGILKFRNMSGTCFRVGTNKIMTALHIIKCFVDCDYTPVHNVHRKPASKIFEPGYQASDDTETDRADASTHDQAVLMSLDDAFVDFNFIHDNYHFPDKNRFKLKPLTSIRDILFFDKSTDCIVLELLGSDQGAPMPNSFTSFGSPQFDGTFHLIGHHEGKQKRIDEVSIALDVTTETTKKDIQIVRDASEDFIRSRGKWVSDFPFDFQENFRVDNPDRFLFHCRFRKGATGSPGIVVDEDGRVIVVTMLLHGYPDWYYGKKSDSFRREWPEEFCVEQGANMKAVHDKMLSFNRTLFYEIFPITT